MFFSFFKKSLIPFKARQQNRVGRRLCSLGAKLVNSRILNLDIVKKLETKAQGI